MAHDVPRYKIGTARVDGDDRVAVAIDGGAILGIDRPGPNHEPPPADMRSVLSDWTTWSPRLDAIAAGEWAATEIPGDPDWQLGRLGDKCLCIGANYTDHIDEMDVPKPPWPYSFVVPPSTALVLSGQPVAVPRGVKQWDWEAEVGVILGRRVRYASTAEAAEAVALYTPFNDLSARDVGLVRIAFGNDMTMVKAHDDSKVIGPVFTPARFVPDPQNLKLRCIVNGDMKQDLTTRSMIYSVAECVAHLSTIMTLEPGDVIATGTGGGVGVMHNPPQTLHDGDVVVVEVDGIGRTETPIVEPDA